MRRVLAIVGLAGVCAVFAVIAQGSGSGDSGGKYWVQLDNAFGLITGGDLKIAGVRAGKITELKLDRKTNRALVGITITENGFGSLRTDVRCESRPQSLIGEYFLDCLPGTASKELKPGSTIPVSQTASTVAPDLVNNVLRRPYRERLAILIDELGAGVAGNATNLNDAIRRASPALRETDKVLALLGRQNKVLADLTVNADKVVGDLAANRKDVGRWVLKARDTAVASAERRQDIALGFRRLPAFLEQLRPTMAALGATADAQTPALRNLGASADQLQRLFENLGPFANASRPAFRALGNASVTGSQAVRAATPVVQQLNSFSGQVPELSKNLKIVLRHLDDPKYAVEDDPRAARASGRPEPTGYTGLEALLTYAYDQTLSTNIFDQNNHILKIGVFNGDCANYADIKRAKEFGKECAAALGPSQPGTTFPDPTRPPGATDFESRSGRAGAAGTGSGAKAQTIDLPPLLPGLPDPPPFTIPAAKAPVVANPAKKAPATDDAAASLLDYLVGK